MRSERILVRLYSHVWRETGYGRAGRELAHCLLIAGVELEIEANVAGLGIPDELRPYCRARHELKQPDVVIVHTLPEDCATLLVKERIVSRAQASTSLTRRAWPDVKLVAYTTYEATSHIPAEMAEQLADAFDDVWVPSKQQEQVFAPEFQDTGYHYVHVVPHSFDPETITREVDPVRHPIMRPFRFYYVGAWNSRKNVAGLINAFARAFVRNDAVELYLQVAGANPADFYAAHASCGIPRDRMPHIVANVQGISDAEIAALHRTADCFVTATRAEGFNLPAFDARIAGRMMIYPDGLGHDDFLWDTNAQRVTGWQAPPYADVREIPNPGVDAPPGLIPMMATKAQGVDVRARWQEPNLIELARRMRRVFDGRIRTLERNEFSESNLATFARPHVATRIQRLLKQLVDGETRRGA